MSEGACKDSSLLRKHSHAEEKFRCNLFSDFITCRKKKPTLFPSCKNHRQLVRSGRRQLACLHNLLRRLFLTIRMQSESASLPAALWRNARLFSNRIAAAAEHPASKPSRVTVCHSPHHVCLSPHPPPSNLLHARTFTPSLPLLDHSQSLPFITSFSPRLNFIPSSSSSSPPPGCHRPSLPICLFTFWQTSVSLY